MVGFVGLAVTVSPIARSRSVIGNQEYVVAPLAINTADCPKQIVAEFTITSGDGFTVIVVMADPEHPPGLPVTLYGVVVIGPVINGLAVVLFDHK